MNYDLEVDSTLLPEINVDKIIDAWVSMHPLR